MRGDFDDNKLLSLKKAISYAIIASIERGDISLDDAIELLEYLKDTFLYIKTHDDVDELLEELENDWAIETTSLRGENKHEEVVEKTTTEDREMIDSIKRKLTALAQ